MQFRNISRLIISGAKHFSSKASKEVKLQQAVLSSTPQMMQSLQLPLAEKAQRWNSVVQGMAPYFISKYAFSLLSSPIAISKEQADILFELKPELRQTVLQLWMPLENHPFNHQFLFNELVAMIDRKRKHWVGSSEVPFNLGAQLNWLSVLDMFTEDNFKKMMTAPQEMQSVLDILMSMKNSKIVNDNPSVYQSYLNQLLDVPLKELSALKKALDIGAYTTKSQIDALLKISDHLHQLCPVHIFLHQQVWLTDDRLKLYDYAESAEEILHILNVPGTSASTFDQLVKNHQMARPVWLILEFFKYDLPLQKACLPLLLDHLDQLSLIYTKLPIIKQILSCMVPEAIDNGFQILFANDHLKKVDQLAELINSSPNLFKNITPEVLSLSLQQIEVTPEKAISDTVQLRKC